MQHLDQCSANLAKDIHFLCLLFHEIFGIPCSGRGLFHFWLVQSTPRTTANFFFDKQTRNRKLYMEAAVLNSDPEESTSSLREQFKDLNIQFTDVSVRVRNM